MHLYEFSGMNIGENVHTRGRDLCSLAHTQSDTRIASALLAHIMRIVHSYILYVIYRSGQ